MLLQLPPPAH